MLTELIAKDGSPEELTAGAEPVSMASGDLDEDGMPDLVIGYRTPTGGVLAVYRGNVHCVFPNSREARQLRASGESTDVPFLSPARFVAAPDVPHFLAAGDFNADGHVDVATAAAGASSLHLLPGDGRGTLLRPLVLALDGPITALASGDVGRRDGLDDLLVATRSADSGNLQVFVSPQGSWAAEPQAFPLPEPADLIVPCQLGADRTVDAAVVAGGSLLLLQESATDAASDLVSLDLPQKVVSAVAGSFAGESNQPRPGLAVLAEDGEVWVLHRERRQDTSTLKAGHSSAVGEVSRQLAGRITSPGGTAKCGGHALRLVSAQMASTPGDEVVVVDASGHRLQLVMTAGSAQKPTTIPSAQSITIAPERRDHSYKTGWNQGDAVSATPPPPVTISAERAPVAALPMRLSPDAFHDMVVLVSGEPQPAVLKTTTLATVAVTSTTDVSDGTTTSISELIASPGADGVISLREAIIAANNTPGTDTISFDIPVATDAGCDSVSGVCTIQPAALPTITGPITIDATTQPSFAGTPVIELDGSLASDSGLAINAGSSVFRGLVFNRYTGNSDIVMWYLGGNTIEGCYFGTDPTGTVALDSLNAVHVYGISGNTIGGTVAAAQNLFAGVSMGVALNAGANSNTVQGNLFGTDPSGTSALGNSGNSVLITASSSNNTIGGTTAGATNVLSGSVDGATTLAIGTGCSGNLIQHNLFGTDLAGTGNLGNSGTAILIFEANNNTIGGSPQAANTIAHNDAGINVVGDTATGNLIAANSFVANSGLAIDLCATYSVSSTSGETVIQCEDSADVSPNDPDDPDSGANTMQNFPVLTSIAHGSTIIGGTLNSIPNGSYTLDFYASTTCNASLHGEGERHLGSEVVTTDSSGDATFLATLTPEVAQDECVTATATDSNNNTSEFSRCLVEGPDLEIGIFADRDPALSGGQLVYTIIVDNFGAGSATATTVSVSLPAEATFISSSPSCNVSGEGAICPLGDLPTASGTQLTIEVGVHADALGPLATTASVAANETEPITINNNAEEQTTVALFADDFESGNTSAWSAAVP